MGNRIFTSVVLLLWLASMSWLVVAKILPPFFLGEPPALGKLNNEPIVCWRIECDGVPAGWSASQVIPGALDTREIHSRVVMDDIPIRQLAPQWMSVLVENLGPIKMDSRSRVALDSLGNLASFGTKVWINDMPLVVKMQGHVDGARLKLRVQTGDIVHHVEYPAPKNSFVGGELTPDARLPRMYVGRRWQREVYSPFRALSDSVELVQAEVVAEEPIIRDQHPILTKRVEYRTLSGPGVAAEDTLRATVWVADDGTVLRQEIHLLKTRLRFERQLDPESLQRATELLDLPSVASRTPAPSSGTP